MLESACYVSPCLVSLSESTTHLIYSACWYFILLIKISNSYNPFTLCNSCAFNNVMQRLQIITKQTDVAHNFTIITDIIDHIFPKNITICVLENIKKWRPSFVGMDLNLIPSLVITLYHNYLT